MLPSLLALDFIFSSSKIATSITLDRTKMLLSIISLWVLLPKASGLSAHKRNSIVLSLVFYSFLPLIRHVWPGKEARQVSLAYLLLNLICSTEHLLFGFFNNVNIPPEPELGIWTHHPRNTLDWFNLIQLMGVCALFFFLWAKTTYILTTTYVESYPTTLTLQYVVSRSASTTAPLVIFARPWRS